MEHPTENELPEEEPCGETLNVERDSADVRARYPRRVSGACQLQCDLRTGVPRADDQHTARAELPRIRMLRRMHLHDALVEISRALRYPRLLVGRHRDHDVVG